MAKQAQPETASADRDVWVAGPRSAFSFACDCKNPDTDDLFSSGRGVQLLALPGVKLTKAEAYVALQQLPQKNFVMGRIR